MKLEGATLEDVFDYFFNVGAGKFLLEKGKRYLHEDYFRNGIHSILN